MSIKAENICFGYKKLPMILEDISFEAENSEAVFILGPNGTGKTTLLKCLCGILKPASGKVYINGNDISRMRIAERAGKIAYVPQNSQDVFGTEAIDIIMLGRTAGTGRRLNSEDKEFVFDIVEKMNIENLVYKKIGQMSGGERQRIFIARALAQNPEVLILDEPTSALDIKNQFETMKLIVSLAHTRGISVVMTVHDINTAAAFADKIMLLKDSKICCFGTPLQTITEENIKKIYEIDASIEKKYGSVQIIFKRDM